MRIPIVPSFWFVGFSGHRRVENPEKILAILTEELRKLRQQTSSELIGISSLAIGGDHLFLRACRAESIHYELLLPFPEEEFRKDFDAEDWQAAQELSKTALTTRTQVMKGGRPESYLFCGTEIVNECDVLVVVWNGLAAAGVGGTKDIVDYARRLQRPLIWIHSETFEVRTENLSEHPFEDKITASMRKILAPAGKEEELSDSDPRSAIQRLMTKADSYATRSAPNVRRLAALIVLLNLTLVGIGSAGSIAALWPSPFSRNLGTIFNVMKFVLFIIVFGLAASNAAKVQRGYWLTCRFAAEVCRSVLATWELPIQTSLALDGGPSEFSHLLRSVCFLRSLGSKLPMVGNTDALNKYVEERIDGQIRYYNEKSAGLRPWRTALRVGFLASMIVTCILMLALILGGLLKHWIASENIYAGVATQLLSFTPLLATSALSLIYVYEIQRRLVHNIRMARLLVRYKTQIETALTAEALESHITRAEHAQLGEVQDWYYYNLYGK
jgi:hypothetical protein